MLPNESTSYPVHNESADYSRLPNESTLPHGESTWKHITPREVPRKQIDGFGREHVCASYWLYGCPVWLPIDHVDGLDAQMERIHHFFAVLDEEIDKLHELKELADQISEMKLLF